MRFLVGLAIKQDEPVTVAATCWYQRTRPHFSTYAMTLSHMREKLLALVHTVGPDVETTVDAALFRVAEKLYLKEKIANPDNGDPPIRVYVPPGFKDFTFKYPHEVKRNHWLLTGAKRALAEWNEIHG